MFTVNENWVKDIRELPETTPENPVYRQPYAYLTGKFLSLVFLFHLLLFNMFTSSET